MAQGSSILKALSKRVSRLLSKRETAATPEWYLKLTAKCMEQVEKWISGNGTDSSLKFNDEQCKYLLHKLKTAVGSANQFLELIIDKWGKRYLTFLPSLEGKMAYVFRLLYALSKEVESFIQGCCKGAWMQSAIVFGNKSEHVAALGSDLEWCTIVFSGNINSRAKYPLTEAEVAGVFEAEFETVKKMASLDREKLQTKVIKTLSAKSSIEEHHLATFLLETLSRQNSASASSESSQSSASETIMKKMKLKEQQLGKGSFGIVRKADWLGTEVAVKTFDGSDNLDFKKEVSILRGLCHPNIVSLLGYMTNKRKHKCSIVMELMDEDLHSLLQRRLDDDESLESLPFTILEAVDMMLQVAQGMFYLHRLKILHRDLKSLNILVRQVKAMEGEIAYVQVKVADFGLSKTKENSMTYSKQTPNMGTTRWMAPEVIEFGKNDSTTEMSKKYPFKSDVYSFGMVCYEILTGNVPFSTISNPNEVKKKIQDGAHPELPVKCIEDLRTLIEAYWSLDPSTRPSFGDICAKLRYLKWTLLYTDHFFARLNANGGQSSTTVSTEMELEAESILRMTENFTTVIGVGSMSTVYRGVVPDGSVVAVKRFGIRMGEIDIAADKALADGFETLGNVRHWTACKVLGYCCTPELKALVMEYLPNGTLSNLLYLTLHTDVVRDFNWNHRVNAAIVIAQGLKHLHHECQPSTVHGDLKPSNILFNTFMEAQIADFGVREFLGNHDLCRDPSRYMAPEVTTKGTIKGDVYSFGIIVLEMITGRSPNSLEQGQRFPQWIRETISNSKLLQSVLDPILMGELQVQQQRMAMVLGVALLCTREDPLQRPYITEVSKMLNYIKTRPQDGSRGGQSSSPRLRTSLSTHQRNEKIRQEVPEIEISRSDPPTPSARPANPSFSHWAPNAGNR